MKQTVGVILPIYQNDRPDYLKLSIESIINQSYKDLALLIGVDGPIGDDLDAVLNSFKTDERVTVVKFDKNRGLAVVLNDLLSICFDRGYEFMARMDADDISMPDRIKKQIDFMQQHRDIDVVGGAIAEIDEQGNSRNKTITYPSSPKDCVNFFSRRNPHAHPAVLFRKSFFDKANCLYRPEYRRNQDTMLWLDGMKNGTNHANIPDVVLKYRMTDSLFNNRRNGWAFAKKQFQDRLIINRTLHYGIGADIFGFMMLVMLISPSWIKKIAYRIFR